MGLVFFSEKKIQLFGSFWIKIFLFESMIRAKIQRVVSPDKWCSCLWQALVAGGRGQLHRQREEQVRREGKPRPSLHEGNQPQL